MSKIFSNIILALLVVLLCTSTCSADFRDYEDLVWPCGGVVVQEFGGKHEGIDITNFEKTPLLSMGDGTITRVSRSHTLGNVVEIRLDKYDISLLYAHLYDLQGENGVTKKGQKVKAAEAIGRMGTTGAWSNGVHLHMEVRMNGKLVDPRKVLNFIPKPFTLDALAFDCEIDSLDSESLEHFSRSSAEKRAIFLQKLEFSRLHNPTRQREFADAIESFKSLIEFYQK